MKKINVIIFAIILFGKLAFSQGTDSFSFVESGVGAWYPQEVHAVFNVAYTAAVSESFAVELSYNLGADKNSVEFHELGVKVGPYVKLGKYSYLMLSAGGAIMFDPSGRGFEQQQSGSGLPLLTYSDGNNLLHIPLQAKLNMTVFKRLGLGMKYTYNKNFKEGIEDQSYFVLFLSYSLSRAN